VPPEVVTEIVLVPSVDKLGQVKLMDVLLTVALTAVPPMLTLVVPTPGAKPEPPKVIVDPVSDPLPLRPSLVDVIDGVGTLLTVMLTALLQLS
jgi:hypothetical protein